ncbi:betaine-aldehyde dehydrogenase [Rhodococcus rhodochrous J3]|uniref:Aldehyde dehydrogenase family protein n=2 Tax=Rhodococcus rhodochrous TaxID=1829 RepID=A0AA46WWY4_RHORH|nr:MULTISPECIES: aldehyde dehydrogenase family protein [Rhodococcus]MBF4480245.1 aldehyde dehydrogenase family protein [Rhodococcus rhodochrous]MCB8910698.1 aldehyde dehydrogenase family protein [Rhodococcus rhodochrous]MDC3724325.1 aldehyde dehydrogenase family protein [Rhodococcus sp. Rp3]MDJ0401289.1 aldehyde dehydrogenase family protein [Rhodococcus rhodochrous]TWH62165.1 aldehyde dehydrogenase (NAD+)/betaine-aldehyde dehydrogenase [Rhodococcus rhodochrous J38]
MTAAAETEFPLKDWVPETRTLLVGDREVEPAGETWDVYNPATEQVIATVGGASLDQVDEAVTAAREAFPAWSALSGEERSRYIHRFADVLEKAADRLLPSIVNEVGTPVSLAEYLQVKMAVDEHLRWAAEAAKTDRTIHLGEYDKPVPTMSDVVYEPVGVVAAITGYNYPLNLAIFKFGAALAAGCTVVLLPSPRTPLTTLFLGDLIREAGLPPGVMNVVIGGADVGKRLSSHPGVDRVSFTGSDGVGAKIMEQAAANLAGVTLELGGKSPNIVLPGVDVQKIAVEMHLRWSRNGGQGCAALARLLVHEAVYDEFLEAGASAFDQMVVGDPWDRATNIGPMIRPDHQARVQGYIDGSIAEGGKKLLEVAKPLPERGWFVNPVLLGNLPHDARAVQEEIFGPVAVILPFKDTEEAIRLANDTAYGLAANVWCDDPVEARRVAERIRAGTVWINGGGAMRPDAPFGGYGKSGVGRELGEWGMREYLEVKHIQWRI